MNLIFTCYCPECGEVITGEKEAYFCTKCGVELQLDPIPTSLPPIIVTEEKPRPASSNPAPAPAATAVTSVARTANKPARCPKCGGPLDLTSQSSCGMLALGCLGMCMLLVGTALCATIILFIIGIPIVCLGGLLFGYGIASFFKRSGEKIFVCPRCNLKFPLYAVIPK